ncbi:divergent polysaccharide deacetylase family protein [Jannaschia sp. LMIT008]|uniref:divergent polysaccharide deacetylase family protein n=1 Tax=Jannaschia maritima TaxID=3032585 RepID=UPI0028122C42|nr:divergent polysaccharide deacetylase family protein [Jannaschia sp. LMIT008]
MPRRIVLDSERAANGPAAAGGDDPEIDPGPSLSIVLVDDGMSALPEGFDLPVTLAVDPTAPGATERIAGHRAAGREVVLLAAFLPLDAAPATVEAAVTDALTSGTGSVAVIDTPDRRLGRSRAAIPALAEAGLGIVARPESLTALGQARRNGVPAVALGRMLEGDPAALSRGLDRAGFEATRDGQATVMADLTPDMLRVLRRWTGGRRADRVDLVPLSKMLGGGD